jgi:ribosome-associated translation inhibitor RaiA
MELVIHGRHLELSQSLRSHTSTRLLAAMDRHEDCVRRVDVRLADVNGPRGGVDKICEILIDSPRMGRLVITEAGDDLYTTITRAAHRAKELLGCLRQQSRWQRN